MVQNVEVDTSGGLIDGDVASGFGAVADAFRANFRERDEVGAAVAVYRDGEKVVDLWGGRRDAKSSDPWKSDTIIPVFSTTKGMAATAMAIAHSRGLFELDQPVAAYWPEFAQNGKQAITVRQLLAHQAGLAVVNTRLTFSTIADVEALGEILAAQAPGWPPGSTQGYHAQSLGWYESQLLRRVDPANRTIGTFFADEVADTLGVNFYIGLPDDLPVDRRAVFSPGGRISALLHAHEMPTRLLMGFMNPFSATAKAFSNPRELAMNMACVNRPDVLRLEFPSMNGVGEVRGIAKVYASLATGGEELGITRSTLDELEAVVPAAYDEIFRLESAFTMGFMKPFPILPFGSSGRAYGHTGMGGSFGFADPDSGIGYAYAMNRGGYSLPTDARELALRDAVYSCL